MAKTPTVLRNDIFSIHVVSYFIYFTFFIKGDFFLFNRLNGGGL